jgi:NhaA family Na+:H+ antiporter
MASGVHATVAGILVALLVPLRPVRDPQEALAVVRRRFAELEAAGVTAESPLDDRSQFDHILDLHAAAGDLRPPGLTLEQELHPVVALLILPLFAFFNAGVALTGGLSDTLRTPVALGIVVGLVLGKQAGIVLFSWIAVASGRAALPAPVTWSHVYGGACLAGFTNTWSYERRRAPISTVDTPTWLVSQR